VSGRSEQRGAGRASWANPFALGMVVGLGLTLADVARRRAGNAPPSRSTPLKLFGSSDLGAQGHLAIRVFQAVGADRIPSAAAGVTFYMLLAISPALSAVISLYGLVADAPDAQRHVTALAGLLPSGAVSIISDELIRLTRSDHGALGFAFTPAWRSRFGAPARLFGAERSRRL
jgi:hypothetical protein